MYNFTEKFPFKRGWRSLALLIMCISFTTVALAQQPEKKLDITLRQAPLSALISQIESQTGYVVNIVKEEVDLATSVTVDVKQGTVRDVLNVALKGTNYSYQIESDVIIINRVPAIKTNNGKLTGQVLDAKDNSPIIGATIKIGNMGTTTDVKGEYTLDLPYGTYSLNVSSIGYTSKRIDEVTIKGRDPLILNITLNVQKGTLKGVEVVATARRESISSLYLKQKNNAAISDGISAEQIRVTPDNNAAQVLKRVSGLTIQDDKFVTVRGLSDRYNNVLLNGAVLPSTEPNRRNFSFDIIPSGIIDNIVVNKTATPDLPSEFTGGLVQVNTKDIPTENYVSVTAGTGYNTNSVNRPFYSTPRGKNDYLGYDNGTRLWWKKAWNRDEYTAAFEANDYVKMGEMNRRIPNNWGLYKYSYNPVQNYQLNIGRKLALKNSGNIGVTIGALYRHDETAEDEVRNSPSSELSTLEGTTYRFRSSLGGVLNIAYQSGGHKIAIKNLYNHLFTNETNDYLGLVSGFSNYDETNRSYTSLTLINELRQHRIEGEHALGRGIKFDWSGDLIKVKRDQPDTRNILATRHLTDPPNFWRFEGLNDLAGYLERGLSIFNSRLLENRYNWNANLAIPFTVGTYKQKLKVGYAGAYRDADFESVGLMALRDQKNPDPEFEKNTYGLPDYELLSPENMRPGYLYYNRVQTKDDYAGMQRLHAGYVMLDAAFLGNFRFIGGIRYENNTAEITGPAYRPVTYNIVDTLIVYKKVNWLPSANLIYNLTPKTNIRLAYSQTLARPDFRERTAFQYYEFKERTIYYGLTGLRDTKIDNYDIRFEFYPSAGEVISVSGFYKKFNSPVELVTTPTSSGFAYFYFNLRDSESRGVEVDFRKSLGFIKSSSTFLSNMYVSGNFSWMKANVNYDADALLTASRGVGGNQDKPSANSRNRPLQGLSPYVINAAVGYSGKPVGVQLSYNRFGPRIIVGGLYPYHDLYEKPRDVMDLQLNARLLKEKLDIRLNISDLLQQSIVEYYNIRNSGGASAEIGPEDWYRTDTNPNKDPRKTGYNPELDYTRYKSTRGTNITFNVTYNF